MLQDVELATDISIQLMKSTYPLKLIKDDNKM